MRLASRNIKPSKFMLASIFNFMRQRHRDARHLIDAMGNCPSSFTHSSSKIWAALGAQIAAAYLQHQAAATTCQMKAFYALDSACTAL